MSDISMSRIETALGDVEFDVTDNAGVVSGNRALSNRFAITFLTTVSTAYLSYGYGGNAVSDLTRARPGSDPSSLVATVTGSCDQTVKAMKSDQEGLLKTEQIQSAAVESVEQIQDRVYIYIRIVPVELDSGSTQGPLLQLPL